MALPEQKVEENEREDKPVCRSRGGGAKRHLRIPSTPSKNAWTRSPGVFPLKTRGTARHLWLTLIILDTWEAEVWRIIEQTSLGKRETLSPTSKITRAKRAGGMAQVVKCLPNKCKALSISLSTRQNLVSPKINEVYCKTAC
jgi:hypothetical protein